MRKSVFTPAYGVLRAKLVAMRKAAGLTQRELARKLGREHSLVARVEQGERRIDLLEFHWWCRACKADSAKAAAEVIRAMRASERAGGKVED